MCMNRTLGVTFSKSSQWHTHQRDLIKSIEDQIKARFSNDINLLINMTWFGPQFINNNNEHAKFLEYIHSQPIDNIFLLASEDPCCYNKEETKHLIKDSGASHSFLLGHFNGKFEFNFYSTVINKYFPIYAEQDLLLAQPQYTFINYNRKPHKHRKQFVNMLDSRKLTQFGIVTLGNNRNIGETIEEYKEGNWGMADEYGIPHDIHSLGRLEYWQNHFLNIVSETNFEDHLWTMLTEKTFKPIIGLRPFVINGQLDVYRYLRQNGFKTFNNYWPHINLETCNMDDIHKNICEVIIWLQTQNLSQMYLDMLPDLRYNKLRFNEFVEEQKHKMENLFA
jgi:hypothetical protein